MIFGPEPASPANKYAGILVTFAPIFTVIPLEFFPALLNVLLPPNKLLKLVALKFIFIKLVQLLNAPLPIEVTQLGIVMFVSFEQPLNTLFSIIVTPLGIVIFVRLEQPEKA